MKSDNLEDLDVAVVGGGVSGLYTAWRLAIDGGQTGPSVALLEASDRLGGRLWSVGMNGETAIPAELGGMFFSDAQALVYSLITDVLDLPIQEITPTPDFAYLRTKRFRISDFSKPDVPPYQLADDERGQTYHELLFLALRRIVPDLDDFWPLDTSGSPDELVDHLRTIKFEGRYLHQWGFWNLLSKVLSNEAYLCLRDLVGSFAMFSNWNGYDAVLSLLWDLTGAWYKLPNGYQKLPDRLAEQLRHENIPIHLNSKVLRIDADNESNKVLLTLHSNETTRQIKANSVVLALPKRAITQIEGEYGGLRAGPIRDALTAVEGVPACKIFLTFDEPWWRRVPDGPGKIAKDRFAVSHTDLPMRQCYYLGVDSNTGQGLMLASYSDATAVPFWSSMMTESGRPSGLVCDVPDTALREVGRQLSEMHDVEVPTPTDGIFVNWSSDPFGGGWHAWMPGWRSYEVMAELRRPLPGKGIHVCGEVSCAYQGWVEGALTSAEVLLQEQFGLPNPGWLSSKHTLGPYRT